jgi:hypothetical protein
MKISRYILILTLWVGGALFAEPKLNFATATDSEHYTWTLNLIGSIHHFHDEQLGEIAIFDLGLTPEQRQKLNTLSAATVYDVEKTNPVIFEKFKVDGKGKIARGWYSWKPVAIKQALEKFDDFFYIDSGIELHKPMDLLFAHLRENGHFFVDCGHSVGRMTIQPLVQKFGLNEADKRWVLDQEGLSAGFQGLTRPLYTTYALPLYKLSSEIANFQDDGSCPKGFGWARHDQTLFSIQAHLLGLKVHERGRRGKMKLKVGGKDKTIYLDDFMTISRSQFDLAKTEPFLRYKHK